MITFEPEQESQDADAPVADAGPVDGTDASLTLVDWVALIAVVAFASGFFTQSLVPGWSPRFAVVLGILPLGTLLLARLVAARDVAAIVLGAAVLWTAVVIPFQPSPMIRLLGTVGLEASLLLYLAVAGCWALGRHLSRAGRSLLPWVLIGGLAVCGLVGVLQVIMQTDAGVMVLERGRAHGLATYSIYYGSLMSCAAVLLAAWDVPPRWRTAQIAGVSAFAVASGLSGSRAALGALLFGVIYLVVRRRDLVRGLAIVAVVGGTLLAAWMSGYFAGRADSAASPTAAVADAPAEAEPTTGAPTPAPAPAETAPPSGSSATAGGTVQRLTGSDGFAGGGISWRIEAWEAGLDAWIERPITGWGVGNFRQAVQGSVGAGFEQDAPRFDAHNIFVELLATLGLPGLLLFGCFAAMCFRRARGPFALAAGTLAWSWLLQPAGISTLPLAMILLGAAFTVAKVPAEPERPDDPTSPSAAGSNSLVAAVVAGSVVAAGFFVADLRFAGAVRAVDADRLESAAVFFPVDPTVADLVAQGWTYRALDTTGDERDEAIADALTWSQRAVDRQPDSPRWLDHLAFRQARFGDFESAVRTLGAALELQPQRRESRQLLSRVAGAAADDDIDRLVASTLCEVDESTCVSGS